MNNNFVSIGEIIVIDDDDKFITLNYTYGREYLSAMP